MAMKRFYVRIFLCALMVLLMPAVGMAASPAWQIVPNESTITFTATQNNAPVSGEFKSFTGEINFDPAQLDTNNVRIAVDMESVTTSYAPVADTLKTAAWFDVKLFPQAVFKANHFTKTGDKTYQANGTLTIRDKTVPVVLNFVQQNYTKTKARVTGSTLLKRTQFGIGQGEWAKTNEVKDEVQVNFALTAVRK
jgi:polyisoprenoid-binding protein YceI